MYLSSGSKISQRPASPPHGTKQRDLICVMVILFMFSLVVPHASAKICAPGLEPSAVDEECVPCPQGTFKPSVGENLCTSCPRIGAFSPAGSTELSDCVGGELPEKVCVGGSAAQNQQKAFWCPLDENVDLRWCGLPESPAAKVRHGHTLVSVDDFVVMFGGLVYDAVGYETWGEVDSVAYVLDANLPRLAWQAVTTDFNGPAGRYSHSAAVLGNAMVIFGGTSMLSAQQDLSSPWMLHLDTLKWEVVTVGNNGPASLSGMWMGHSAAATAVDMIVYGGKSSDDETACSDVVWALSAMTWNWTQVQTSGNSPGGLCWHTALTSGSSMVVIGGYADRDLLVPSGNIWSLDTNSWAWTALSSSAELPPSITGAAFYLGALAVFSEGCHAQHGCAVSSFDIASGQWAKLHVAAISSASDEVNASSIAVGGKAQKIVSTLSTVFAVGGASYNSFSAYALKAANVPFKLPLIGLEDSVSLPGSDGFFGFDLHNYFADRPHMLSLEVAEILPPNDLRQSDKASPRPRESFGLVVIEDKLALFGGATSMHADVGAVDFTIFQDTWVLDRSTATWTQLSTGLHSPTGRQGHSMVTVTNADGTLAYVFGGASGYVSPSSWLRCSGCSETKLATEGYEAFNETWVLDIKNHSWTLVPVATTPEPREGHAAVVVDGQMIVIGGVNFNSSSVTNRKFRGLQYGDVWAFAFNTGTWTQVATQNSGPGNIFHHAAMAKGGKILVSGGCNIGVDGTLHFHNDLWELSNFAWRKIPVAGQAMTRAGHTSVIVGSSIIVFGGYSINAEDCPVNQTASCVVSLSDTWKGQPSNGAYEFEFTEVLSDNPPAPRRHHGGVLTGADLFVMGGTDEWVGDGARWKSHFPDSAYLPVGSVVLNGTEVSGIYLSMAINYQSVLFPASTVFQGATIQSSTVLAEPYMTSIVASSTLALQQDRTLLCSADNSCQDLTLKHLHFTGAEAAGAASSVLRIVGSHTHVMVESSSFRDVRCMSSGCSAFVTQGATVEFMNVMFSNGSADDAGAVAVVGASASFSDCVFDRMTAEGVGGSIMAVSIGSAEHAQEFVDYPASLLVYNSSFSFGSAGGGGGAVMCANAATCAFEGSSFSSNTATFFSNGGAILANNVPLSLARTDFADNTAVGGAGGAIFWHGEEPQTDVEQHSQLCSFNGALHNIALYGPCVATNPINIMISNSTTYSAEASGQFPGLQIEPHPSVYVTDAYNQTVTVGDRTMTANLYVVDPLSAILQGATAVPQDAETLSFEFYDSWLLAGIASVDESAVSWRTASIHLQFLVFDPYSNTEISSPTLSISLSADICPTGHTLQVSEWNLNEIAGGSTADLFGACKNCPATTYALGPLFGTPSCQPCPLGATCAGGDQLEGVGDWVTDGSTYTLVSCPAGYSLESGSAPEMQQCKKCNTDGLEYILHPNNSPCQRCPTGLVCYGDRRYTPVINGSTWAREGDQLVLQSCPAGYFKVTDIVTEQRCEPCGPGYQCLDGGCAECSACPPGSFKEGSGPHECSLCPRNTYNPVEASSSLAACLSCQASATGVGDGATSIDECVCERTLYLSMVGGDNTCSICPVGARCLDGSCSLSRPNGECSDNSSVLGDWVQGGDGVYRLVSCPDGYELRDYDEVGHDDQACVPCHPSLQYIVSPNNGTCQPCPGDLLCGGGLAATPRTTNSTWVTIDGVYYLVSCPPHYYKFDGDGDVTAQECVPCPIGQHCPDGDCTSCSACPSGTYKDFASATPCTACPRGTYGPDEEATARSQCISCPPGAVTSEDGLSDAASCVCGQEYYLQDGSSTSGGDVQCVICPTGAFCSDGTCAFSVSTDLTCPQDGKIVGDWVLTGDGTYRLLGCPEGYAMINSTNSTSNGDFFADIQQCNLCDPDREYNVDPNSHQCEPCPPGLQCFGNSTVNNRLDGSIWTVENGVYYLQYCPAGYYADTDEVDGQECKICGIGVTCAQGGCDVCTPCPPGSYKSVSGLGDCLECPKDTYSTEATSFECTACPVGATTNGTSEDSVFDCVCDDVYYSSYTEAASLLCNQCPPGAVCLDGDCALRPAANLTCSGTPIVGEWQRGDDDRFYLENCPEGYSLVNSSDGTSRGDFTHDIQQCRKCKDNEYILRPNLDICQRCPPGLSCNGSSSVTPVVSGSNWTITQDDNGNLVFTLVDCPTGYQKTGSRYEIEQCTPCPRGTECTEERCTECGPCPAGTYKENAGLFACANCPNNTFGTDVGATSLQQCQSCPRYAFTKGDGHTQASACQCDRRYYFLDGAQTCAFCPQGAICSDLSCALAAPNFTCPNGDRILGDWAKDTEGLFRLQSCPPGTTLVNSTVGTQEGVFYPEGQRCKPCDTATQYIINPNMDQCQTCPPGLVCGGDDHVDPVIDSSWKVVDDYWYLVNCSSGYYPFRGLSQFFASQQRCLPCGAGEFCTAGCQECSSCLPGTYKDSASTQQCTACPVNTYGPAEGATDRSDCLGCPRGATTNGTGRTDVTDCTCSAITYRREVNGTTECMSCPDGAVCSSGSCAFAESGACPDRETLVGTWIVDEDGNYILARCPPGFELHNTLPGGVFDSDFQHCRACHPGLEYVINPNTNSCQPCPIGLECIGNADPEGTFQVVTEADLDPISHGAHNSSAWIRPIVDGSVWEAENGQWVLVSCPTGYYVSGGTPETQQCTPCPAGEQCTLSVCTECFACPMGTYKASSGAYNCIPCPVGTYFEQTGGNSLDVCISCPSASTTTGVGSISFNNCTCGAREYTILQPSPFSCQDCPLGGVCPDDSCAFNLYTFNEDGSLADLPQNQGLAMAGDGSSATCSRGINDQGVANIRCSERTWYNFTCKNGRVVVGDWVRDDDGRYRLVSCPNGYSLVNSTTGTSSGEFSEASQWCKACRDWEFIINPNTDSCQTCPTGLICDGTGNVVPKTEGAEWVVDGDTFRLVSCPTGYRLFDDQVLTQQCIPCDIGTQCTTHECTTCEACPIGTYKEGSGPYACFDCPIGTYYGSETAGATTSDVCVACPTFSTTSSAAMTSKYACVCNDFTYQIDTEDTFSCESCPVGAMCADDTCALRDGSFQCPDSSIIVGNWVLNANTGQYHLISCPAGHSLVNTSADGSFFHDGQQCRKCLADEYVLSPNTDECQSCPPGLICDGSSTVTPRTTGASWVQDGDIMRLESCPTGYAVYNGPFESVFGASVQQCVPCGQGEECALAECTTCTPCAPGMYKDFAGTDACRPCPINTFADEPGTTTVCLPCPEGSTTNALTGQSSALACACEDRTYITFDPQLGPVCSRCPVGAVCPDETCAFQHGGTTCPDGSEILGDWEQDETDLWRLVNCSYGYSLINSTHGTSYGWFSNAAQHCKKCHEETRYILNPNTDSCHVCPTGLQCDGGSNVEPRTPGSRWDLVDKARDDKYVLKACPSGYEVYNPNEMVQECRPCDMGSHCPGINGTANCTRCTLCPVGYYKDSVGTYECQKCPIDTYGPIEGARDITECRECPTGAFTESAGQTSPDACKCARERYSARTLGGDLICPRCPKGAECFDGTCALGNNHSCAEGEEFVGDWVLNADGTEYRLVGCPAGYSLVNSTDGTSSGEFSPNVQHCKACLEVLQYIINPNTDQCQTCPMGLQCNGTGVTIPKTPGANWVIQDGPTGAQWMLESCPSGSKLENEFLDFQRCEVCGLGEHCPEDACTVCSPCPPGSYKPSESGALCTPCPINTYGPDVGATAFSQCLSCPDNSQTTGVGAVTRDNCTCLLNTYQAHPAAAEWGCVTCPFGARCLDGSCAFSRTPASCPGEEDVPLGTWTTDPVTDEWILRGCPDGTALVNSTSATSSGDFSRDVQQCQPCTSTEYILNPNTDQCQPCPVGLVCNGGNEVTPRVPDSTWVREDDVWILQSCAQGHYVVPPFNERGADFNVLSQMCEPCGLGEECGDAQCTECSVCAPGTYKDAASPELCLECGPNTYNPEENSKSAQDCIPCPSGASTPGPRQISRSACTCSSFTYTAFDQDDVMRCRTCPEGAKCLDQTCALANPSQVCEEAGGDVPVLGTWERDTDESFVLKACPEGYKLINGTDGSGGAFAHDLQKCERCPRNTYILGMLFDCKLCPPGLSCNGTAHVESVVNDADWVPVGDDLVLQSCPTGYRRVGPDMDNLDDAQNFEFLQQECVPCGVGEECTTGQCTECTPCMAGTYKEIVGPMACAPCPLNTYGLTNGSTSSNDCRNCPAGSITLGLGSNKRDDCMCEPSTFETAETETAISCSTCPAGGICPGSVCAFRENPPACDGVPIPGEWVQDENGDQYLQSCPEGYSLWNTTLDGTFLYEAQRCVKCLTSQYILAPNAHECQTCPLGFKCFGNSTVVNRVPGSTWVQEDDHFKLKECPSGYRLINDSIPIQFCDPCPLGYECVDEPCFVCTQCNPGYFKDTKSDSACIICPSDTYNTEFAGTNFANCEECPEGAFTDGPGQTSPSACKCSNETYPMTFDDGSLRCRTCPAGGVCDDGSCALRLESRQCPDGSFVVGEWEQQSDNVTGLVFEFNVLSCPMGYSRMTSLDGTSTGVFFHDAQQCVQCQDEREYVINPNTDTCMRCPPGLRCNGTNLVESVYPGANWTVEGDFYRLHWCPQGYSLWSGSNGVFDQQAQDCLPCPRGESCPDDRCTECTPCPMGTFKDSISPEQCVSCLPGYFSSTIGATTIAQCIACPKYSYTTDAGATNLSQCICFETLYRVSPPGRDAVCSTCPAGAVCNVTDERVCALTFSDLSCPSTGRILGEWTRDETDYFKLLHCPRGTQMMNSTDGTSFGDFSHSIQQCRPCRTCSGDAGGTSGYCVNSEYNIDPNKYLCQVCPDGARCNGDLLRTANNLDTIGAQWAPDEVGRLWLVNCPTGYRMRNDTGYEHQKCEKCPQGEYIFRSDDPTFECYPCPEGAICINGGPPTFGLVPLESSVSIGGISSSINDTDSFDDTTVTTLTKALEQTTGFPEGSIEITEACMVGTDYCIDFINPPTAPTEDVTTGRRFLSKREFATAKHQYAARERSLARGLQTALRSLLQADSPQWTVNFRAIVPGVSNEDLAENLTQTNFADTLVQTMKAIEPEAFEQLVVAVPENSTNLGDLPNSRGEKYTVDTAGRAQLVWCGNGYLLVNDTFKLRQCAECRPTTYSLHPLDNCNTLASEGHCLYRECTRCPRGAECEGNNAFTPKTGSEWEIVYDPLLPSYLYRLKKCDIGRALVRLSNASQEDECVPCPRGSYAFEATEYGDEWLQPTNPELLVDPSEQMLCLECPTGALCRGATQVLPVEGYWRGQNMVCRTSSCNPKTHSCPPHHCRKYPGSQQLGTDDGGSAWRLRAMIYRCRPGHCFQNMSEGAFDDDNYIDEVEDNSTARRKHRRASDMSVNFCRAGHEGPLCGVCMRGWAMTGRNCARCDGSFNQYRDMLLAFLIVFAIFMTYAAAWRPLMNDWETEFSKWATIKYGLWSQYYRRKKKQWKKDWHRARYGEDPLVDDEDDKNSTTPTIWHHIHGWFHASLTDFCKIYISFFQVSGGFMTQVNVQWPNVLDDIFIVATSIVQIDLFTFPGLSCALRDIHYREKLIIMTSLVPTIIFFLVVPTIFAAVRFPRKLHDCLNQFYYSAIFFIFITYGSTSRVVFDAYACHDLGVDGQWLRSEPAIICPENDPDSLTFWWAVICTFIYPLGIPVLLWSLLILHGVPNTVKQKQERAYLSAILEHFMQQNEIPEKMTEMLQEDGHGEKTDVSREQREMVEISVISSKHLPKMDAWGTVDPYVVLRLDDVTKRTQVVYQNYEPEWGADENGDVPREIEVEIGGQTATITVGPDDERYEHGFPVGEKFMFPLYDGVTQDLEVRCMDWDFGSLNPDDEVGTGWVTNEELRQLKEEEGKIERKVVLELDGEAVKNGFDGKNEDAFVLLKLRKVSPQEMQEELDRIARLRKLLAFIGINYGDQVGQLSTKEQNEKIKKLYDLRKKEANTRELIGEQNTIEGKRLWRELEEQWQDDKKKNGKDEGDKDEKAKSKKAGLSLVRELQPEEVHKLEGTIEKKLRKIANANKKKKESAGEHVKSMLQRVLGLDVEQYMEYGVKEFREVLEEMGQNDVGHSVIKGMIDRYGKDNKIDNPKIHAMVQKVILVRNYLRGTEEPDDLDKRQLSELIYMSKFHQRTYRPSDAAHHHTKEPPQERLRKAQEEQELELNDNIRKLNDREDDLTKKKEELREILLSRAKEMETRGELVIPEPQWVGSTRAERHAINRVGFLIYSYRCKYWWYEIADMFRKLLMITITVFGFDGTVSQVALGMMVTLMYLLLALVRQPYRNRTLGVMCLFSLSVQSITFFYGIVIATGELDELAGEAGSRQRYVMGVIVTILNCILILIPIFDLCFEILPGRYFLRQLLIQYLGFSKKMAGIVDDEKIDVAKPKEVEENKPHAQAQFHLLTLKTFLRERREKTEGMYEADPYEPEAAIVGYQPGNAKLVYSDEAAQSGALARWVPTVDPDSEITEAGAAEPKDAASKAMEISFTTPLKAATHASHGGVSFVDKPSASQVRLREETKKMQEAFKAATQPYLKAQATSAYSLKPPSEEDEDSSPVAAAGPVASQAQKAAERRQVLEETLAELPEDSESRAQVEQMLRIMEESGPAAAGARSEISDDDAAGVGTAGDTTLTSGKKHHHRHHHYRQQHTQIHDTSIASTATGVDAEHFPFQMLFGEGVQKLDPNSFILGTSSVSKPDPAPLDPELKVAVERGKPAKDAKSVDKRRDRRKIGSKKKAIRWPAIDESDGEGEETKGPRAAGIMLEADLALGNKNISEKLPSLGGSSPVRSVARSDAQSGSGAGGRGNQFFSRINVPLPHMHHHELLSTHAEGEMPEEDLAVGGRTVAPENVRMKLHAPGVLLVDKKEGDGKGGKGGKGKGSVVT